MPSERPGRGRLRAPLDGRGRQRAPVEGHERQRATLEGRERSRAPVDGRERQRAPLDGRALTRLAKRAGAIGLAHFRRLSVERSRAGAIVSEADREIERQVRADVAAIAPQVVVIGAELPATGAVASGWTLAVDPIDGADAYVAGLPTWGTSLGLLHAGSPVAGVVYLPSFDDLYLAHGGTLRWNGREIPQGGVTPQHDGFVLAYSEYHRRRLLRLRGQVRALGSTAYHLSLVARGAAEAAVVGRVHLWDVAAGKALLDAVGGELVYLRSGNPVDLAALLDGAPSDDFMIAARVGSADRIRGRVRRR